jgi:uncharacterized membrane protein YuzA (DUF378 family)
MDFQVMIRYCLVGLGCIVLCVVFLFICFGRRQNKPGDEEKKK